MPLPDTETYVETSNTSVQIFPITGTIALLENESVELYLKRLNTGTRTTLATYSLNLRLN